MAFCVKSNEILKSFVQFLYCLSYLRHLPSPLQCAAPLAFCVADFMVEQKNNFLTVNELFIVNVQHILCCILHVCYVAFLYFFHVFSPWCCYWGRELLRLHNIAIFPCPYHGRMGIKIWSHVSIWICLSGQPEQCSTKDKIKDGRYKTHCQKSVAVSHPMQDNTPPASHFISETALENQKEKEIGTWGTPAQMRIKK